MLYWGMFTAGFIIGVVFCLGFLMAKTEAKENVEYNIPGKVPEDGELSSWDIFDRITKVNYSDPSSNRKSSADTPQLI